MRRKRFGGRSAKPCLQLIEVLFVIGRRISSIISKMLAKPKQK